MSAGNALAIVRWTAPGSNGGSPITRYEIQVVTASGAPAGELRTVSAAQASVAVTGLTNGKVYRFRVRAVNDHGTGAFSELSAKVTPRTVAATVATFTAAAGKPGGDLTVTLRWNAPRSTGGALVTAYRISWGNSVRVVNSGSRSLTLKGKGKTRYTIRAITAAGAGTPRSLVATPR